MIEGKPKMSMPADDEGKSSKTEMSKPAELIYRNFFDELRFTKQQQWSITNYALLLMGTVFGVARLTPGSPILFEKAFWSLIVAIIWGGGLFVLLHLQVYLDRTRERQERMEETFSIEDKALAQAKPADDLIIKWLTSLFPDGRIKSFVSSRLPDPFALMLCLVVTIAGFVAGYAIWRL